MEKSYICVGNSKWYFRQKKNHLNSLVVCNKDTQYIIPSLRFYSRGKKNIASTQRLV